MKENRRIAAFRCIGILTLGTFRLSRIFPDFVSRIFRIFPSVPNFPEFSPNEIGRRWDS